MTEHKAAADERFESAFALLPNLPKGWYLSQYRVLADGELAALVIDMDLKSEWSRIHSANGNPKPPSRVNAMVDTGMAQLLILRDSLWQEGPLFPIEFEHLIFDQFADGRWLVVATRTDIKPNARVFAADGALFTRFMLGDGIEHVAIDRADNVWVGWFDEGIYGNENWIPSGEEKPPSIRGIGCFDPLGRVLPLPDFPPEPGNISDCYALTTGNADAWVCTYTDFPILHLQADQPLRWWKNNHAGPSAIAVNGSHALLAGGYGAKANQLTLVVLGGSGQGEMAQTILRRTMPLTRLPVSKADWAPVWDTPILLQGCGDTIHLIDGDHWFRWCIADLLVVRKE